MQTKSTGHILSGTILFAVFLVLFFANIASASTVYYDKLVPTPPAGIYAGGLTDLRGSPSTWDYAGFRFSSSTTFTFDTIASRVQAYEATTTVRWRIYDVNGTATSTTGNLIATSDFFSATPNESTQTVSFPTPVTLLWSHDYQFILDGKAGESWVIVYSWGDTDIQPTESVTTACYNTEKIKDCAWSDITYYGGLTGRGWPAVKLTTEGILQDGEYLITFAPCSTDTRSTTQCEETAEFAEFLTYDVSINTTQDNRKLEVFIENTNGEILDSFAYYYTDPGNYDINTQLAMVFGSSTNAVYVIRSCLLPADEFALFTPGNSCTTMVYGNGTTTQGYIDWWTQRNPSTPNAGLSAFEELGCGDIAVTEVGKAFRCALLWAFEPSQSSLAKFSNAKNLVLTAYPIGYLTYMWSDFTTAVSTTSTDIFTREVELGKYFGRPNMATTTFTIAGTETYIEQIKPVTDKINILLWLGFGAWFAIWAMTRKL